LSGIKADKEGIKILFFDLSAVFLAFFLYEGYLWLSDNFLGDNHSVKTVTGTYSSNRGFNPYFGYGPKNDGAFTTKKTFDNRVLYNVVYTFKNGLRETPNTNETSINCALFFGCSFTFGAGLPDSATLPFYFNKFEKENYKVLNYGFDGYGPHQMLAGIQTRVDKDINGCDGKKVAIYSFIPEHIQRAAGLAIWDRDGPRYEIKDGKLVRDGTFRKFPKRISGRLRSSYIYNKLFFEKRPDRYDILRCVEIIKKAKELLNELNIRFYIFIWDNPSGLKNVFKDLEDFDLFVNKLKESKIRLFFLHDVIPDFDENDSYFLPHDGHPSDLANEKIAEYLSEQIDDQS
jgi:hypothetical protein